MLLRHHIRARQLEPYDAPEAIWDTAQGTFLDDERRAGEGARGARVDFGARDGVAQVHPPSVEVRSGVQREDQFAAVLQRDGDRLSHRSRVCVIFPRELRLDNELRVTKEGPRGWSRTVRAVEQEEMRPLEDSPLSLPINEDASLPPQQHPALARRSDNLKCGGRLVQNHTRVFHPIPQRNELLPAPQVLQPWAGNLAIRSIRLS
mmetsp:Transcript_39579/g.93693  ORF Transcript_39579/g.93693 Transcript_39579/m.93693 type:complete len:205 (-) Transcript_39579:103-717(-)